MEKKNTLYGNKTKNKKAAIIACFFNYSYETRLRYFEKAFKNKDYDCIIFASDFDHRTKKYYSIDSDNVETIHVPTYFKNISSRRIFSHIVFSLKALLKTISYKPDVVYVGCPPNFNAFMFAIFKSIFKNKITILSISDMWPETFPMRSSLLKPFFNVWATIRNRSISHFDYVLFECDLFNQSLNHFCNKNKTIYMSKHGEHYPLSFEHTMNDPEIHFAYLGSLNNILDVSLIDSLLEEISNKRKTILHIIGAGEKKDSLISVCERLGVTVNDYGVVYDEEIKENIFNLCDFGLNIMKSSVYVGATMKSLDYLYYGLPIINSIQGDTYHLVEQEQCGFNICSENLKEVVESIEQLNASSYQSMRYNARRTFDKHFSEKEIMNQINSVFDELGV